MRIDEAKLVLPSIMKNDISVCLWGHKGTGKSTVPRQIAQELGIDFEHVYVGANCDVGDIIGLLHKNDDGTVSHLPPKWLKRIMEGSGIVLFDELNRAHPDIKQALFSFFNEGTIGPHKKSSGWKVMAACNYENGEYTVEPSSDIAWISRFCHINFVPGLDEFVSYAESRGAVDVADFIQEHPEMRGIKSECDLPKITPDERAWLEKIARLDQEDMPDNVRMEVYSGIVGQSAAATYITFKKSNERRVRISDVLKNYGKVRTKITNLNSDGQTRFDLLAAPLSEFINLATKKEYVLTKSEQENLKQFLLDIPLELVNQNVKKLGKLKFTGKDEIFNDTAFVERLLK